MCFEMKCLRSMTGVSRLDRVRNEVVRARTDVRREVAARIDKNVLRWIGHVDRMENERLLKKVMIGIKGNPVVVAVGEMASVKRKVVEDGGGWAVLLQQCDPNSSGSLVIARRTE